MKEEQDVTSRSKRYRISLEWFIEEDDDGTVAGYEDIEEFLWECRPTADDFTITLIEE